MNVRLLRRIAKVIQERPKEFDMDSWHRDKVAAREGNWWVAVVDALCELPKDRQVRCTTTHCIAGWAQVLSPDRDCEKEAEIDAIRLLEIDEDLASRLFYVGFWPRGFGGASPTAKQAAARIEHFIQTKGAE